MRTQSQLLGKLLSRKCGATPMEIIVKVGTVCPHKRMADLKAMGWTITKQKIKGKTYHRYYGQAPQGSV